VAAEVEHTVVMMRHGESLFNKHNVFTGWCDVPLTANGRDEACRAGRLLAGAGLEFDVVFCSVLQRSTTTAHLALASCGQTYVEVRPRWELNERHYGALQGLNKAQVEADRDPAQVKAWRSSYHAQPPPMQPNHPHYPLIARDRRYAHLLKAGTLPASESIADTAVRVMDLWAREIAPLVRSGKKVLVVAHRNSLRALVRNLEGLDDAQVASLRIPTGAPFVYPLRGDKLRPSAPPLDCEPLDYSDNDAASSDLGASGFANHPGWDAAVADGGRQVAHTVAGLLAAGGGLGAVSTPDEVVGSTSRRRERPASSQLPAAAAVASQPPVGCGFQGRFLEEGEASAAWAANRATCLTEWDKDPAHPPDECLLAL
jgi:2,3-bisphosphoglycerate-dependent phosphoglycerate mutase